MKMNRNFNEFIDFKSLELEVPTFCLVTGCVSARRDRRYPIQVPYQILIISGIDEEPDRGPNRPIEIGSK